MSVFTLAMKGMHHVCIRLSNHVQISSQNSRARRNVGGEDPAIVGLRIGTIFVGEAEAGTEVPVEISRREPKEKVFLAHV